MTNLERIRMLEPEELANLFISALEIDDYDENEFGQYYICGTITEWVTLDGKHFTDENDAVLHMVRWFNKEEDNEDSREGGNDADIKPA